VPGQQLNPKHRFETDQTDLGLIWLVERDWTWARTRG
jgi:hypothetical protein